MDAAVADTPMSPVSPAGSGILDGCDVFCEEAWAPLELSETEKECDNRTDSRRNGAGGNATHVDRPPKSARRTIRREKRETDGDVRKAKGADRGILCKSESNRAPKTCVRCACTDTSLWRRGPAGTVFHTLCNSCYLKSKRNEAYLNHPIAISDTNSNPLSETHAHSIMDADLKSIIKAAIESEIRRRRKAPVFNKKKGGKAAAAAARRAAELAAEAEAAEPQDGSNHEDEHDDDESATFLDNVEHQEEDPNKVYCYCRQPYDPDLFYIQCDGCDEWYHGVCANIKDDEAERIFLWFCRICERDSGRRPVFKKFCAAWLAGEECRLWTKEIKAQMKAAASLLQVSQPRLTTGSIESILPPDMESLAGKIPFPSEHDALVSVAPTQETIQQAENDKQRNQVEATNELAAPSVQPQIPAVPENTDSTKTSNLLELPAMPSHMFKTPKSCLKYLPDPIAPRLNQNTSGTDKKSNPVPTSISGGTSSRYCSDECGLSVSRHAFQRILLSASTPKPTHNHPPASPTADSALPHNSRVSLQLHPRIHLSLHERAVSSRSEIYSLEAYDALDRERLLKYARQRETLVQRLRACESVQGFLEGCSWRAAVVNWFVKNRVRRVAENGCGGGEGDCVARDGLEIIGEDVDKENEMDHLNGGVRCKSTCLNSVDSKVKAAKKKKRRIRNGGGNQAACDGTEGGGDGQKTCSVTMASESPLCGFDSRILECFQLMDNQRGSEKHWGEEDEDGIDMDALENAASIDDVKGAIVETICIIPVDACKSHHDWEDLKMSEVQLEIETLVQRFKEICEDESRLVDSMRKRRSLMRMTL
ncbi:hypothetical protein HDU80_000015 [Chytriomyces hyalinus]|nr:hypothetical protein HDU80_000015 [Chytriomyces hyalinus]